MLEPARRATLYSPRFFSGTEAIKASSAAAIADLLADWFQPVSVIDIGCGTGIWLEEFRTRGVEEIFGVDGPWVREESLRIPAERFMASDLEQPLTLDRRFDLAISLEVAEHLPEAAASSLVASLVAAAPVVVFSGAIPRQGGTAHLNEQWPPYWASLFGEHGFDCFDVIRERVWERDDVAPWYRQNVLVFVDRGEVRRFPRLVEAWRDRSPVPLSMVHPEHYFTHLPPPRQAMTILRDRLRGRLRLRSRLGRYGRL